MNERTPSPNVILILADDLGYSDLGCYGGEIRTPALDGLAERGVRLTQFYNTARCSPSRASLLTGLHPHQTGIGILTNDDAPQGYPGTIDEQAQTIAEMLRRQDYQTVMFGKWHLSHRTDRPDPSWPVNRGFDSHYGTIGGSGSYYAPNIVEGERLVDRETLPDDFYYTDEISERAATYIESVDAARPFFMYVAYTAPHWPLHAPEEVIRSYNGVFDAGWDVLRERRLQRMRELGVIPSEARLSERARESFPWDEATHREWEAWRMQTFAAQVEIMDRGIGRILEQLESRGLRDDTVVVFLSDNGASAENLPQIELSEYVKDVEHIIPHGKDGSPMRVGNSPDIVPGPSDTFASYGPSWANLSTAPFRRFKKWVHQGGIAAPFIVRWPNGDLDEGGMTRAPHQLVDVVPTLLEACGVEGAEQDLSIPLEGRSMLAELRGAAGDDDRRLYWEHVGNAGVRRGDMKLVRERGRPWELYDVAADPTELDDLAPTRPELVADLAADYQSWADRVGVLPWSVTEEIYRARGLDAIVGGA